MSDIIDTRDLEERRQELEDIQLNIENTKEEINDLESQLGEEDSDDEVLQEKIDALNNKLDDFILEFDQDELDELNGLAEEICEWRDGSTLINASDWIEYVQELCEDIGDVPRDFPSYIVIDWEATANNLESDYSTVDYKGETYYYRSI